MWTYVFDKSALSTNVTKKRKGIKHNDKEKGKKNLEPV